MVTDKQTLAVLEKSQYDSLVKSVGGSTTFVSHQTTELQAGYQLGVQAVLEKLRDGFVVNR